MRDGPQRRYEELIAGGQIAEDAAQAEAVAALQALADALTVRGGGAIGWLVGLRRGSAAEVPGLYMWGGVGRGKTMLMDLFFDALSRRDKQRAHFHGFMADVHTRIAAARTRGVGDPIPVVAQEVLARGKVICFDEFHVTDIADAMILGRLFEALFAGGAVLVTTSNVPPSRLYWNGLNRDLFKPFITMLETRTQVLELAAERDYRLERLAGQPVYLTPLKPETSYELRGIWRSLTGVAEGVPTTVRVQGRDVAIPEAHGSVAWFRWDDLFAKPLGATDYLEIARTFETVFLDGVPHLAPERRNEARRFISFVDSIYDQRRRLILTAAAEPDALHPAGDEAFLFERTASRLMEMRSADYLAGQTDTDR